MIKAHKITLKERKKTENIKLKLIQTLIKKYNILIINNIK